MKETNDFLDVVADVDGGLGAGDDGAGLDALDERLAATIVRDRQPQRRLALFQLHLLALTYKLISRIFRP